MRITERLRYSTPQARIQRIRSKQLLLTEQLSSGKRINRPSDDPMGSLKVSTLTTEKRSYVQYQRNIDAGNHLLNTSDSVLNEATNTLLRTKELAIQSLNSSLLPSDRNGLADEVASMRESLRALANTKTNNRYIFGGFQSTTAPYDPALGFVGDSNATQYDVGQGHKVKVTTAGGAAFGDGTPGTIDVFNNLLQLEVAIRAGFEVDMQDQLGTLETSVEQVIQTRQGLGIQMGRLQGAQAITDLMQEKIPDALSKIQDTDFAEVVAELKLVETSLEATLATSGRLMSGASLLDFL